MWMDTNDYDIEQTYSLEMNHATLECYFIHFKTLVASSGTIGNFFIDGYGSVPNECYSKQEAECDIQICGRRTLVLRAFTSHEWQFNVSGDIGRSYDHKTVPGGIHNETAATMDIDEYDYLQVFELIPYSSCVHRAFSHDECETNPSYMQDHCLALCNLVPLFRESKVQLKSSRNPSMCLTSEGNFNYAKLFYSDCRNDDLNQVFIFKRLKSDRLLSFGRLFSSNRHLCVEMDMNSGIMMYSACQYRVEILDNGALKHVEAGTCFGVDKTDTTKVIAVDCNSKDVETWIATNFSPPLCDIERFNGYSLLGSDDAHCYRLELGELGSSSFEQDADNKDCVEPFVEEYRVGELTSISNHGVGFYTKGDSCGNIDRSGTLRIFQSSNVQGIEVIVDEPQRCKYEAAVMVANCETVGGSWTSLQTLNLCADLDDWTSSSNGMKVHLVTCNPAAWSQHWRYDNLGRLVNRYNQKCLEAGKIGNIGDEIFVMDCNDELYQRWSRNGGRYLNQAYSKYIGVIDCGDTNNDEKWLELQILTNSSEICKEAQIWHQVTVDNSAQAWNEYVLRNVGDGNSCPLGTDVPESECLEAANTFSSITDTRRGFSKSDGWDFTPCGCFLWKNPNVPYWYAHYDRGQKDCKSDVDQGRLICRRKVTLN